MAIFVDRGQGFAEQEVAPIRVLGRFTLKPGICADENGNRVSQVALVPSH